jgi:4-hydroxybenzoate polyprenyltransferase
MAASADSWTRRRRQLRDCLQLMRLDRPIGIWLLLWPTLWALWIACDGRPPLHLLVIFLLGTVAMRSAGCVANDLTDRNIDPHVARTRDRPLAARRLSPYSALTLLLLLIALALVLVLQLNRATIELSFAGAALTLSYPFFKRFFPLPQLYLGLAFAWGIPMAFSAQLGFVPRPGWLLLVSAVLWAMVYDTFYAMVDRQDDLRVGVRSSAISFGDMDLPIIAAIQAMVLLSLWLVGRSLNLGVRFQLGLVAGAALFAWQQWLARGRDGAGCFQAFRHSHYFGVVILAGIIAEYAGH